MSSSPLRVPWPYRNVTEMVADLGPDLPELQKRPRLATATARAMMQRWPREVIVLATRLTALPPVLKNGDVTPCRIWSFIYGLDELRHNPSAIRALANVVDQLDRRPTRDELFVYAYKAIETRRALYRIRNDVAQHRPARTPRYGFHRTD